MHFDIGLTSILGTRQEQQDELRCQQYDNQLLAAVCDGMGGMSNGHLASLTAIRQLFQLFEQKSPEMSMIDFFLQSVDMLDESVYALRKYMEDDGIPGTTLVSAAISGNMLNWLSVGDSRMYIIRGKEIVRITTDHNYYLQLKQELENGDISHAEYREKLCQGETLISYLGMGGIELMDRNTSPLPLQKDDIILLMSDGLYRSVSEQEMILIASPDLPAQEITDKLVLRSQNNSTNTQDNTSVIAIKML